MEQDTGCAAMHTKSKHKMAILMLYKTAYKHPSVIHVHRRYSRCRQHSCTLEVEQCKKKENQMTSSAARMTSLSAGKRVSAQR